MNKNRIAFKIKTIPRTKEGINSQKIRILIGEMKNLKNIRLKRNLGEFSKIAHKDKEIE